MPKPSSYNVYYNLLLKQLKGDNAFPIKINNERLDTAVNEVIAQIAALGPDRAELEKAYEDLRTRHPKAFDNTRPDLDTIGPAGESRYDYSQRCLQEVMKGVKKRVRQDIEWGNATVRVGVPPQNGEPGKIATRWMYYLMKTDGSPESLSYNDSIAALGALGQGLITADQYLKLRSDYHMQHDNMTAEQAAETAQADMDNGAQFLFDEVSAMIEADREQVMRSKQAALSIQRGDLSAFQGDLQAAFDCFYADGGPLSQLGEDILNFLRDKLSFNYTEEQKHDKVLEWLDIGYETKDMDAIAEQVSNPYFAILDPARCDYYAIQHSFPSMDKDVTTKDDFVQSFAEGILPLVTQQGREIDSLIKPYGVDSFDELPEEKTESYRVFSSQGRTIIIRTGEMSEKNFLSAELASPSRYALRGQSARVQELLGHCAGWSRTSHTSEQFEAVRQQLEHISSLKLNVNKEYSQAELSDISTAFATLLSLTDSYFKRKEVHHNDTPFEAQRIEFMRNVKKFAELQQRRLGFAVEHMQTVEALRQAVIADGPNPEWQSDPKYAGMSAVQHNIAVAREQAKARAEEERAEARRLQEEAERPMREAREAMCLDDGARNAAAYDDLLASCNGPTLDREQAAIRAEDFIAKELEHYRTQIQQAAASRASHNPEERAQANSAEQAAFASAKRIVAGYVIAELLVAENRSEEMQGRPGAAPEAVDTPIRKLLSNGKVEKLAEIISSSALFIEQYALKMSDRRDMQELIDGRANVGGLVRAAAYHAGQEFMNNMKLAKQQAEQAPAQNQVNVEDLDGKQNLDEDDRSNRGDEAREDDLENNNRINLINDREEDENDLGKEEKSSAERDMEFNSTLKGYLAEARSVTERTASASIVLNKEITSTMHVYRSLSRYGNDPIFKATAEDQARLALAGATLKYMINKENPSEVLRDAVERGQTVRLMTLIENSAVFEKNFNDISPERVNAMLDDEELFCRPVGDALLALAKDTLEPESIQVSIRRGKERRQQRESKPTYSQQEIEDRNKLAIRVERILEFANGSEKCDWVKESGLPYDISPAKTYISEDIEYNRDLYSNFINDGSRSNAKENVAKALAGATLRYMLDEDPTGMVLEDAVERGQILQLLDMISESRMFKDKFREVDLNDTEGIDALFEDEELFVKPLGDKLISMTKSSLEYGASKVVEEKKADLLEKLKSDITAHLEKAEQAHDRGDHAEAEKYGIDTLVLQSTYVLLASADEKGKLPKCSVATMAHRVRNSKPFNDEIAKVDLKKPGELNRAISQRVSIDVVKSIVEAENRSKKAESDLAAGKVKVTKIGPDQRKSITQ